MEKVSKLPWGLRESLLVLLGLLVAGYGTGLAFRVFGWQISLVYRYLLVGLAQAIAVLGGLHYFVRWKNGLGFSALGLKAEGAGRALVAGLAGGLALFFLVIITGALLQTMFPNPSPQPFADLVAKARGPADLIIPLFLGTVLAPLTEELYFRGFLFPALKDRYGLQAGLVGSGVIFALLHLDLWRFLPLALGGIGLAYLYERTGNILASIIAHATWNTVMILLLYFALRWV
ncbi:MAG: protease family protein [Moorella sp. (in: firmicutes)]|nr:protease family protein [Moorella sp. (in: firmicutes)]